jgi:hypothetical protein
MARRRIGIGIASTSHPTVPKNASWTHAQKGQQQQRLLLILILALLIVVRPHGEIIRIDLVIILFVFRSGVLCRSVKARESGMNAVRVEDRWDLLGRAAFAASDYDGAVYPKSITILSSPLERTKGRLQTHTIKPSRFTSRRSPPRSLLLTLILLILIIIIILLDLRFIHLNGLALSFPLDIIIIIIIRLRATLDHVRRLSHGPGGRLGTAFRTGREDVRGRDGEVHLFFLFRDLVEFLSVPVTVSWVGWV